MQTTLKPLKPFKQKKIKEPFIGEKPIKIIIKGSGLPLLYLLFFFIYIKIKIKKQKK